MPPPGVRTTLTAIVLFALLPPLAVGGVALHRVWDQQREELRRQLVQSVAALAAGLSREIFGSQRRLELLVAASGPAGDTSRLEALARHALASSPEWRNVVVWDASGRQAFNLRMAGNAGEAVVADAMPAHRTLARTTGRSTISDSHVGLTSGAPLVTIAVPVGPPPGTGRLLEASLDPDYLVQLFDPKSLEPNAIGSLVDREGVILARTRDAARWIGRPASPEFLARIRSADSGVADTTTLDGVRSVTAWARVPEIGWTVIFGLPAGPGESALRRSVASLAAVGFATLLVSSFLAWYLGRELVGGIERSARGAVALATGEAPEPATTRLREIADLQRALVEAHGVLRALTAERDASEAARERLYREERAARALAESANKAKDEFLAMLAHELRNPLAAISNATHILDHAEARPDTVPIARDVLRRQTAHLARMVDDLLDVGRLVTGKVRFEPERVDLGPLVERAVANARMAGDATSRHIACRATSAPVLGDPTRIEQIVANLVGNAIRHTTAGGRIDVSVETACADAILTVTDDGQGIDPELLPRIFELFVQGKQTLDRSAGGLGIGLTVVERLASMHGGTVKAASPGPGKGATFEVRIPLVKA